MCNLPTSRKGLSETENRKFSIFLQNQDIDLTSVQRTSGTDGAIRFSNLQEFVFVTNGQISRTSRPVGDVNIFAPWMHLGMHMMAAHLIFS
jgi:hypothetical protein